MSVYKIVELIGTSPTSWEDATRGVLEQASKTLRNLRVAEVSELDVSLTDDGKIEAFRVKVKVSLKYEGS
jgi:hypothetical protein